MLFARFLTLESYFTTDEYLSINRTVVSSDPMRFLNTLTFKSLGHYSADNMGGDTTWTNFNYPNPVLNRV